MKHKIRGKGGWEKTISRESLAKTATDKHTIVSSGFCRSANNPSSLEAWSCHFAHKCTALKEHQDQQAPSKN